MDNPFRRQRDTMIETCVNSKGWCTRAYHIENRWPSTLAFEFAPRDHLAKFVYDLRFNDHTACLP